GELAPAIGLEPIGDPAAAAGLDPVQDEPGTGAERIRDGVLGQQEAGGQAGHVVELDGDRGGLAGRYPGGRDLAHALDPVAGPAGRERGKQRQEDQHPAEAHQLTLADAEPEHTDGDASGYEGPAPSRDPGEQRPHPGPFLLPALNLRPVPRPKPDRPRLAPPSGTGATAPARRWRPAPARAAGGRPGPPRSAAAGGPAPAAPAPARRRGSRSHGRPARPGPGWRAAGGG